VTAAGGEVTATIFAVDPGPTTCGAALLSGGEVLWTTKGATVEDLCNALWLHGIQRTPDVVLIERVQSYGQAGRHLLETSESVGRLLQAALSGGHRVVLIPRRLVCKALDVSGAGKDAQVAEACRAILGPKGTKANPGPTYGVTSHGWQALGLALAYREAAPSVRAEMDAGEVKA
jgi:hypothetical protein